MNKICGACARTLPQTSFNKKGAGYQSKCRECQKSWYSEYYKNSDSEKNRLYSRNKNIRLEIQYLIQERKSVPCMDCQVEYPYYVMDFDHRDPSEKLFTIARYSRHSLSAVESEINKCDVVCANCHRERTHGG